MGPRNSSLPQYDMLDFIAWNFTKNGIFSVRFAYVVEWNHQHGRKLCRTNGMGRTNFNPIWRDIWKLSCSAKVNFFIWRTLHGTLSCRVTLANRHMKVSPICPCSSGQEDTKHLLFQCQKAKEVWRRLGLDEIISRACDVDGAGEAVLEFLLQLPDPDLSILGSRIRVR